MDDVVNVLLYVFLFKDASLISDKKKKEKKTFLSEI